MRSMSILRASTLAVLLSLTAGAAYAASSGDSPDAQSNAPGAPQTQVSQFPSNSDSTDRSAAPARPGNDARQGQFYDDQDQYLDPRSGQPVGNAPVNKDSGG